MFNGKMKAVTFSYDDNVVQDKRFTDILNKYGLKGTFNLNSKKFADPNKPKGYTNRMLISDARDIYNGHEIAVHTLTHPDLTKINDDDEIVREVEEDRLSLSELAGYEVVGMAYPFGTHNEHVENLIKTKTGIKYARTTKTTLSFDTQTQLLAFNPTLHHGNDKLFETAEKFINLKPETPQVFYIWGHAYEFDNEPGEWERIEEFCKFISGKNDIFYGTNKEILLV